MTGRTTEKEQKNEWKENHPEYQKQYQEKYYQNHYEEIKEQQKKYYDTHKEQIKQYYQDNKEQLNTERFNKKNICDICKSIYTQQHKSRHEKSAKHIKNLDNIKHKKQ